MRRIKLPNSKIKYTELIDTCDSDYDWLDNVKRETKTINTTNCTLYIKEENHA